MGAFDYGSYTGTPPTRAGDDARLAAACVALKKELDFNGFGSNLVVDTPVLGEAFTNRVKEFQAAKDITVSGKVGAATAKELFRKRVEAKEDEFGFPRGTIGKKLVLESACDPVAIGGTDPDDSGIAQINVRIHTGVSLAEAFDPEFAIDWVANYLKGNHARIIREVNVMKAARASYNIGVEYAKQWMQAGFPASGGPMLGSVDSFARATEYIRLIDKQVW
jgi:hypothetical protein